MSTRVLLPNDVQSLIDEIRPYLSPDMKEIDVIRSVLVDFKLNHLLPKPKKTTWHTSTAPLREPTPEEKKIIDEFIANPQLLSKEESAEFLESLRAEI